MPDRKRLDRLFVFDLDNTALGGYLPYHKFPERFVAFLNGLRKIHIHWATCTTWGVDVQFSLVHNSGIENAPAFLSGASGLELARVTHSRLIPDAPYKRRIEALARAFRRRNWPGVRLVLADLLTRDLVSELAFSNQNILSMSVKRTSAKRMRTHLQAMLTPGQFYDYNPSDPNLIMFLPYYMNKGAAVVEMQKRLGIGAADTIVAGDGTNDLSMMAKASRLVCPANAAEAVKTTVRAAGGIVGSKPYSDGVIEAMRQLLAR